MRYDEEEPQHFLGIPIGRPQHGTVRDGQHGIVRDGQHGIVRDGQHGMLRGGRYDTRPRVLGIPTSGFSRKPVDLPWLRHPIRFARWRLEVRRLGPYARRFDDIS
jgi:hypothetical protein